MSFASPAFTQAAYPAFVPQSYVAYNGGAMFVPSGGIATAVMMAAGMQATPGALGGRQVRPVPVSYVRPNARARVRQAGMVTPAAQVVIVR